ncbi:hypothetical protein ABS71_10580 [bacterium SCN 62-11]|nr:MAG: hypothetical protein ABS71_10580 [bacterium SCN 62-11]
MKKTLLSALVASALLFGFATAASAGSLSAPVNITATVNGTCTWLPPADVNFQLGETDGAYQEINVMNAGGNFIITCNLDMPYTVTSDAAPGGQVTMTGQTTGKTVNAFIHYTDDQGGTGPLSSTESLTSAGTGEGQFMTFGVDFNTDSPLSPAVDVYTATTNVYLNF